MKGDKTVIRGSQAFNVILLHINHGGDLQRIFVRFADGQCRNGARLLLRAALIGYKGVGATGQEASPGRQAPGVAPFGLLENRCQLGLG